MRWCRFGTDFFVCDCEKRKMYWMYIEFFGKKQAGKDVPKMCRRINQRFPNYRCLHLPLRPDAQAPPRVRSITESMEAERTEAQPFPPATAWVSAAAVSGAAVSATVTASVSVSVGSFVSFPLLSVAVAGSGTSPVSSGSAVSSSPAVGS